MRSRVSIALFTMFIIACKKPYNPPAINSTAGFLVVEGVINSGPGSTIIKLSRTVSIAAGNTANPETGAIVAVESDQNVSFPLAGNASGTYVSPGLNLDITRKYRLSIKTADNEQYFSDYVPVNITPPIDSVGFSVVGQGLQIYVNAHNANTNSRYYRWDCGETWQFHAEYESSFVSNDTTIVPRTAANFKYNCWQNDTSSNILLASTASLTRNVIYQNTLITIPSTSEKIETEYSIFVRQYTLTGDAYAFWTNLRKDTQQLGSVFDAQPSQISGNIHNFTNPAFPAIGYISACTVQSKRIFIFRSQLPQSWVTVYPYSCDLDSQYYSHPITHFPDVAKFLVPPGANQIPIYPFMVLGGGYISTALDCVDCTLRGTTKQPAFWH